MSGKLLKITYHDAPAVGKKLNAYMRSSSYTLSGQYKEIESYLFEEHQLPKRKLKIYWIDANSDEIEIINDTGFDIFLEKCKGNLHLHISAIPEKTEDKQHTEDKQQKNEDDPSNFFIHDGIECDGCGVTPFVGFRYKCLQCANFDLCQFCEAAHKHADHIMVRIPTNDVPNVVVALLSGSRASSTHHRRFREQCPFTEATASTSPLAVTATDITVTPNAASEERRRSDSLDHGWQMIDNTVSPPSNASAVNVSINRSSSISMATDSSVTPVSDFKQLDEKLRQHVNEEQRQERTTTHTQTQVDTMSTSTSTTSLTNSPSTSAADQPKAPTEKRAVPVYHTDERINGAVHAMMAMGFSNEGAWLTQLLDSVHGNIPAALEVMHTSQNVCN